MKTYVATVCLTKSYTDKMCNQVLLQKEFPDEKAAHVWLNKALKRYNYVKGIKDLCYVSWFRWMTRTATNFYISIIFRPMYRMKYRCV